MLRRAAIPAAIAAVTFATFLPTVFNGFVELDDRTLFLENEHYRGLGWPQLSWMATAVLLGHHEPVTWLTHGLGFTLWGLAPAGHHLMNVVVHAANAVLFYFLSLRLLRLATGFTDGSLRLAAAASALFFALHPLRAESVAWVTERRGVLSGLFFLATLLLYLQARERAGSARTRRHVAACVCFLLASLSKSSVMTLPLVLVILDAYPLRQIGPGVRGWLEAVFEREKLPYWGLGFLAALLAAWAVAADGVFVSQATLPWWARPSMVTYGLAFYASKTLMPVGLGPLYVIPPDFHPLTPRFLAATIGVVAVTIVLIVLRRRWPALLAVAASYAVLLSPVSGLLHAGIHLVHDRYSYLPCLGFAVLVGGALGAVLEAGRRGVVRPLMARATIALGVVWIAVLAVLAADQATIWRNNEPLFQRALDVDPNCYLCRVNLATHLLNTGRSDAAIPHFRRALDHAPVHDRHRLRTLHHNYGLALANQNAIEPAIDQFRAALNRQPDDVPSLMNLGVALMRLGRVDDAVATLRRASLHAPDDPLVLANFGAALLHAGRSTEAGQVLDRAIARQPNAVGPRFNRIFAALAAGDRATAERQHASLRALDAQAAAFIGPTLIERW